MKIGEYPRQTAFRGNQTVRYKHALTRADEHAFHKAEELNSLGYGAGSLTYLRGVFEHFINGLYDGDEPEKFRSLGFRDKLKEIKPKLPLEVHQNSTNLFKALSGGIHKLDEEACNDAYNELRNMLLLMLHRSAAKAEEEELIKNLPSMSQKLRDQLSD